MALTCEISFLMLITVYFNRMPSSARAPSYDRDAHRSSRSSSRSRSEYDRDRGHRSRRHRDRDTDDDYYYDHDDYRYRRRRRHRSSRSSSFFEDSPDRSYRSRSRSSRPANAVQSQVHHVVPEGPPLPPKPTAQEELLMSLARKLSTEDSPKPAPPTGFYASLLKEYKDDKSEEDPVGDDIPPELAEVLRKWWWTPPDKDEVKKMLKLPRRPANADAVKKVWMNTEVFKRISPKGREADNPYRYINNSIAKGAQPLVAIWADVIRAESILKDYGEREENGDASLVLPDRQADPLNITAIRKALDLSLQILGMANAQLVTSRKMSLKNHLHKDFHDLCDKKRPFSDKMFGDNIKQQIEDISKYNRISSQLNPDKKKSWNKPQKDRFLSRGRGSSSSRGRGFNPRFRGRGRGYFPQKQQTGLQQTPPASQQTKSKVNKS